MSWCLRPSTWSLKVFMRKPKRLCASCWPVSSEGLINEFECKVLPFRLLPIFFNPLLSSSFVITIDQIKFFSYANFFDPPLSNSFVITIDQINSSFFVFLPTFLILLFPTALSSRLTKCARASSASMTWWATSASMSHRFQPILCSMSFSLFSETIKQSIHKNSTLLDLVI